MKVLVTGAGGFLGSALVARLAAAGYDVIAVGRSAAPPAAAGDTRIVWRQQDLIQQGLAGVDTDSLAAIFHLAAAKDSVGGDDRVLLEANELMTMRLARELHAWRGKCIFASSQMVYGDPGQRAVTEDCALLGMESTPYACSKLNSENWLRCLTRRSDMSCIALRFCGFVEGGGNVDYIIDQALQGMPIELFARGAVCRDYLSLQSGVDAFMAALAAPAHPGFEPFNIGSGEAVTTVDLARLICSAVGSRSEVVLSDRPAPRGDFVFDIGKARRVLKFEPASLRQAVVDHAKRRQAAHGGRR